MEPHVSLKSGDDLRYAWFVTPVTNQTQLVAGPFVTSQDAAAYIVNELTPIARLRDQIALGQFPTLYYSAVYRSYRVASRNSIDTHVSSADQIHGDTQSTRVGRTRRSTRKDSAFQSVLSEIDGELCKLPHNRLVLVAEALGLRLPGTLSRQEIITRVTTFLQR